MEMAKLRRLCVQQVEAEVGASLGELVEGEEQLVEDVVGITRITTTTTITTTMMMTMEVDLLVEAVGVLLGEEVVGLVREERGVEGVVLEMLVQPGIGGLVMVRPSPSSWFS
jgi:hypothetical protein